MTHTHTPEQVGLERAYQAPVARDEYFANPSAHGSVVLTERCTGCGLHREVAANQGHREYGPWYDPEIDTPVVHVRLATPSPESFAPQPKVARPRIVRNDA